jgi:hypothetical protein
MFPDYINYFQTADGVAVSHAVSYDEIYSREPNSKYEATMNIPGGDHSAWRSRLCRGLRLTVTP